MTFDLIYLDKSDNEISRKQIQAETIYDLVDKKNQAMAASSDNVARVVPEQIIE